MKPDFFHIAFLIIAGYFAFLAKCGSGGECPTITSSDTLYIPGDTVLKEIEVDRPYPVWRERVIPGRIDTVEIIRDYFTKYFYSDTISEDSNFIAVINDTLFGNQIISRKFFHQNLRQTAVIVNNTLTNPPRFKAYLGAFVSGPTFGAGGSLHLVTKRDLMFSYGYRFTDQSHQAGIGFKIKLKK